MRNKIIFIIFPILLSSCAERLKEPAVELTTDRGTFSITSRYVGIKNINVIVYLNVNGVEKTVNLISLSTQESVNYFDDELGSGEQILIEGTGDEGYKINLKINNYYKNFFTVKILIENLSVPELIVKGFDLTAGNTEGSEITGADKIKGLLANGYQSWSPAIVSKLVDATGTDEERFENIENNEDTLFVDFRTSWWFSALYSPEQSIISGALSSERFKTRVLNYLDNKKLIWKVRCGKTYVNDSSAEDKISLIPGQSASSETIFIGIYTDAIAGLEEYGKAIALINPPPQPPFIPVGWNSWNELFTNINETKILENVNFIKNNFPQHGFNNIQIDDGWERSWGDWEPNPDFPSGMDGIAIKIKERGFIPGIWLAPFLVSDTAPLFTQHPDWLLRDDNGSLLKYDRYYILDTTNHQAMDWLLNEIQKIINWGYRYLKLDFLFAGAYEGKRFSGETSMMAYRSTMKKILELAQQFDAYVLACGAPILPTAGLAHGARIGGDIAFSAIPYNFSFIKNEARNVANRFFLNYIFANDPDTALIRDVSLEEAKMNLTSVILSGKIFALGDDLQKLTEEKISLIKRIKDFPVFSELKNPQSKILLPEPLDMFSNFSEPSISVATLLLYPETYYVPSVWAVKLNETSAVVGLFNWNNEEKETGFMLKSIGLDENKKYKTVELWSNSPPEEIGDEFSKVLAPETVELIYIFPRE